MTSPPYNSLTVDRSETCAVDCKVILAANIPPLFVSFLFYILRGLGFRPRALWSPEVKTNETSPLLVHRADEFPDGFWGRNLPK
jgi:hypothetical protein